MRTAFPLEMRANQQICLARARSPRALCASDRAGRREEQPKIYPVGVGGGRRILGVFSPLIYEGENIPT